MKKLIPILLLASLFCVEPCFAKRVQIAPKLTIEIPEDCLEEVSDDLFMASNGSISLYVKSLDMKNFKRSTVVKELDEMLFNVEDLELVKTKGEGLLNMSTNYSKKFYTDGESKFVALNSYIPGRPYSILFSYEDKGDLEEIDAMIDSIKFHGTIFQNFSHVWGTYKLFWVFFALGVGMASLRCTEKGMKAIPAALLMTLVFGLVLFILLQDNLSAFWAFLIATPIVSLIAQKGYFLELED
ncbi:MAG: hypothetical protein R3Y44_03805 [Rikenellaceae bacterium]